MRMSGCLIAFICLVFIVPATALPVELTKTQAITRVKTILRNNTAGCRINKINSVTASRVDAGWRVTSRIVMSASGRRLTETAVWTVNAKRGAVAQDQLAAEIAIGCP